MLKRLLARFTRDRVLHKSTVRIDFFPQDMAVPHLFWHASRDQDQDAVSLALFFYARILYELAELNETRVARELMAFMDRVRDLILNPDGPPKRPRLPLGSVTLGQAPVPPQPPLRRYRADFYSLQDGSHRLDFQGSVGKESFFLPASFLVFFQSLVDSLPDEPLRRLVTALARLHDYYRFRRDFWDGSALDAGPAFALGTEELKPEEPSPEA